MLNKAEQRIVKNLVNQVSKSYQYNSKELHFWDGGKRQSVSGIRATIFGATGFLGPYIGAILGYIGSDLVFPHNHTFGYDDYVKELKLCAAPGMTHLYKCMNYESDEMLDRVIKNSNVVINLIGPRQKVKYLKEAEYINIELSRRIAKACARNPNVQRLIHFSACGAEKDSPSIDFRTKWYAEQELKEIFPNATIFRPTTVYGMQDYFVRHWYMERDFWYHFNIVTDDCTAKRQPILINDVAQCVLNALKLPETAGQTYELGGPHVYTRLEIFEALHHMTQRAPKLVYVPYSWATKFAQGFHNWEHFSLETMVKNRIDIVVGQGTKTIDNLYVRPVSFPQGVEQFIQDIKARYGGVPDQNER